MRTDSHRNYDEMSTARLTWVVLDRLVPPDDESVATAALIARDPELHSLVNQGMLTEHEALEKLRTRQARYGADEGAIGDRLVRWARRAATFLGGSFFAYLVFNIAR
ncbi:MAG TPA: hypothetical protein VJS45_12475 [Acidimicrobiia bacterium]|jgi:hypothetical protein|nr:hypothetical protein [Acidimicrobiia bacterium]